MAEVGLVPRAVVVISVQVALFVPSVTEIVLISPTEVEAVASLAGTSEYKAKEAIVIAEVSAGDFSDAGIGDWFDEGEFY